MTSKSVMFVAHDPGGYDVVHPIAEQFMKRFSVHYYCVGPAAKLNPAAAAQQDDVMAKLDELLRKDEIGLLVAGTSWGSDFELKLIGSCKQAGIPTAAILDYWSNYALRLLDNGRNVYPDYYIVMDELARKEAIAEGVPERIVHVLGHPGLDKYMTQLQTAQKRVKDNVLILSQPLSKLYGKSLGYIEEEVIEDVIHACQELNKTVHIKFHPKDDYRLKEKFNPFMIDGPLNELISGHETIVGMNSMGLLHAAIMGHRVISYQPDLIEPDLCITNKLGITQNCKDVYELKSLLSQPFTGLDRSTGSYLWMDGRSTGRTVHFLKGVINNEN